jgi:hypothetical protein
MRKVATAVKSFVKDATRTGRERSTVSPVVRGANVRRASGGAERSVLVIATKPCAFAPRKGARRRSAEGSGRGGVAGFAGAAGAEEEEEGGAAGAEEEEDAAARLASVASARGSLE